MKIYSVPEEIPAPQPDYGKYDHEKEMAAEEEHKKQLKQWLINKGYDGLNTGRIYSTHVADGYAQYMIGESEKVKILIHLPYGDAYHNSDVEYLPFEVILSRIDKEERMAALFGTKE